MSENLIPHTLDAFLSDLVEIRQKNEITLDDIRVRTKVYPHIIAQFEKDGLNEHPLFNVLYLKAFVRSYADVVGISPEIASQAYEDALGGRYNRRLAVEYLGHELSEPIIQVESKRGSLFEEEKEEPRPVEAKKKKADVAPSVSISTPAEVKDSFQDALGGMNDGFQRVMQALGGQGLFQWGVMGAVLVLGAFFLFKLVSTQNESMPPVLSQEPVQSIQETSVTQASEATSDTSEVDVALLEKRNRVQSVIDRIASGDSLKVTVVAAFGKLDPFRVKVDRDLRRPYWLDEGDSLAFWFGNQVTVEDNLDKMVLLFEGVDYAIAETDSTARVLINRDSANAFMYSSLQ